MHWLNRTPITERGPEWVSLRAGWYKPLCTRTKTQGRQLSLHPREAHEALAAARARQARDEERRLYGLRAGIEGTLSQGLRAFGLRQARYRGLAKMHLQNVATAVALNVD